MATQFGRDTEGDVAKLLRINFDVVESLSGKLLPSGSPLLYMESLALKLFGHTVTAFHLWRDEPQVIIPGFDFAIGGFDWSSTMILARACTEVVTAFNYLYIDPKDDDEAFFRHMAWMLAGFTQRVSLMPAFEEAAKAQQAKDAEMNEEFRTRIQQTAAFDSLSERAKDQVLKGQNWHPGMSLMAMCEAVFGRTWGRALYSYMSSHTHADALSAVQVQQTSRKAKTQAETAIIIISLALSQMTAAYVSKWDEARKVYEAHPYRELNEFYVKWVEYSPEDLGLVVP